MHFEKIVIQQNFNKAFKTYDEHCEIQNKICKKTVETLLLHKKNFESVVDFACGTGESTKHLINNITFKKCYGIDFSESLLEIARNKLKFVDFRLSDFDDACFDNDSLELIFSNMGLQWSLDLTKTLSLFNNYLKKQGFIVFSTPTEGNFPEINIINKIKLLSHENILSLLEQQNWQLCHTENLTIVQNFCDQITALRSIKNVGARVVKTHAFNVGLSRANIKNIFITENENTLTYKIGIYIARKV